MKRTYSELIKLPTFLERYEYLRLQGSVGLATFGSERFLNQEFYKSRQWRDIRNHVIARDNGDDLAIRGNTIHDRIYIHHMNPMDPEQIARGDMSILNPEYLISTTHTTHNAIHYGDAGGLSFQIVERRPGDTKLW